MPPGTFGDIARAYGINDHDVIIGMGTYRISADPVADVPAVYHWTSPQAQPAPVKSSNDITQGYAAGSAGNTYDVAYAHRSVLSNDGRSNPSPATGPGLPVKDPSNTPLPTAPRGITTSPAPAPGNCPSPEEPSAPRPPVPTPCPSMAVPTSLGATG